MRLPFSSAILLIFLGAALPLTPLFGQATGLASLEGTVVDVETGRPVVGAIISVEAIPDERFRQHVRIGPTGLFRFLLDPKMNYYILTEANGYQPTKEKFIISSGYTIDIHGKVIYLKRGGHLAAPPVSATRSVTSPLPPSVSPVAAATVVPAKPVIPIRPITVQSVQTQLKAVQFVQSKAELLPDAQPALNQLLTFLRENPVVRIELAGHTDNQGDFDENLSLSKQRVEVVKAFLVTNGIVANRIVSRGYGSTRPIAPNTAEATRRLNRRVEMVILTK